MSYEGKMDIECISLCDAINKLPGISTIESCSGHNKKPFNIWFDAEDLGCLPALLIGSMVVIVDFMGGEY